MSTPDWRSGLHGGCLGCFKDDEDRAILNFHFISDVAMSVNFCLDICAEYRYLLLSSMDVNAFVETNWITTDMEKQLNVV